MLEEMDEEFGIGDLVSSTIQQSADKVCVCVGGGGGGWGGGWFAGECMGE